MNGRWSVALATGVLFAGAAMGAIVVAGQYPRTADPRLVLWFVDVLATAVAVLAAARVEGGVGQASPAQRVGTAVFVGFLFGVLALAAIFAVVFVSFAILIAVGLHNDPGGTF